MAEGNSISSSQESLPLSQETFRYLMEQMPLLPGQLTSVCEDVTVTDASLNMESHFPTGVTITDVSMNMESPFPTGISSTVPYPNICLAMEEQTNNLDELNGSLAVQVNCQQNKRQLTILPASENWEGLYFFKMSVNCEGAIKKGATMIYSNEKKKLFIDRNASCAINFSTTGPVPDDAYIRAMALFSSPNHAQAVVERCLTHCQKEIEEGVFYARHLIRSDSKGAVYETDQYTQRHSVVVPYEKPAVGQMFSTYVFKFACFTSCAGGPNRRPLMVVFTLETRGEVIGRQKMDVRVCACPARDIKFEENETPKSLKPKQPSSPVSKTERTKKPNGQVKRSNPEYSEPVKMKKTEESGPYTITVNDRNCYKFLKGMRKYFVMYTLFKNSYPDPKDYRCLIYTSTSSEEEERQ